MHSLKHVYWLHSEILYSIIYAHKVNISKIKVQLEMRSTDKSNPDADADNFHGASEIKLLLQQFVKF